MKKTILSTFFVMVILFGAAIGYNYMKQEEMIFRSIPLDRDHTFSFEADFDEVFLPVGDGEIHGVHFKTEGPRGAVLFLHGRSKNLDYWGKRARFFLERNLDVFIIDYRGFGKSSAGFKEHWFLEDSLAAFDYLKKSHAEENIIVYGCSLGTSMAAWVAANRSPKKLILESPFYSMLAAAAYAKPYLPLWAVKAVLKYPLQTHKWIGDVRAPIYIFHGKNDKIVPFAHSELLYEKVKKSNNEVVFIPLEDWGHSHLENHDYYQVRIEEIL